MDLNTDFKPDGSHPKYTQKKSIPFICTVYLVLLAISVLGSIKEKYIQIFFPNGERVSAELAASEESWMKGLMFRKGLNEDQGMLFVFEEEGRHAFWMKNVNISIDIIWMDRQKRIVHIEHRVPPCREDPCPSYSPGYPSLYVLELCAGAVEALNLQMFDRVEFVLESLVLN